MSRRVKDGFYLGKRFYPKQLRLPTEDTIPASEFHISLYDLLTHCIILGMTGSGKTVLGKIVIEEAALKGIPSILIDPKGDLASMKLFFPSLKSEDFIPWIEARKGSNKEKIAKKISELYKEKLHDFNIPKERLEEFHNKTKVVVLTPRSTTGIPLSISSLPSPPPNVKALINVEPEIVLDLIDTVVKTLIMRIFPKEPIEKHRREEKFLNSIVRYAWENDVSLEGTNGLAKLVELVENPPIQWIGVMDVESYISSRDRHELAININNLLVGVEQLWHLGIPLDIDLILDIYSRDEKTPIIVFNLNEIPSLEDKIFIVSRIAYAIYEWMRRKGGSEEPRLIFYIDEIGGGGGKTAFFPIHPYNPPSKPPLMLLIKQARAFGVCCIFSTQNPGDIDYKGLSNCGTWIIGKLSTRRDRDKALQGLGDIELFGTTINRRELGKQIASLETGEFICKTKDGDLEFFKERWLMSYHKTMTSKEIRETTDEIDRRSAATATSVMPTKRTFLTFNYPASLEGTRRHFREGVSIHVEKVACTYMPLLFFKIKTGFKKRHPFLSKEIKKDLAYGPFLVPLFQDEIDMNYTTNVLGLEKIRKEDLLVGVEDPSIDIASNRLTIQDVFVGVTKNLQQKIKQEIMEDFDDQIEKEREKTIEAEKIDLQPKLDELYFKKQKTSNLITDLTEQKSQIEDELENLKNDKARRLRRGEPIVRISQSITSRQRKVQKIERQISKLQDRINNLNSYNTRILDSQNRKIRLIEEQFNSIKKEIFKEIDFKIVFEDTLETFVPICTTAVSVKNHELRKLIELTWNGFNGERITPVSCGECSSFVDRFSPLNFCFLCLEFLCEEHAKICAECGKTTCKEHSWLCICGRVHCTSEKQKKCQECESLLCANCRHTCEVCGTSLCGNHVYPCATCFKNVCKEHSWKCATCNRTLCSEENTNICSVSEHLICEDCKLLCNDCGKNICETHSFKCDNCRKKFCLRDDHFKNCVICGSVICNSCLATCEGCKKALCVDHHIKCPNCGKSICQSCLRLEKKFFGLIKTQKCVMCI